MIEFVSDRVVIAGGQKSFKGRIFLGSHWETFVSCVQIFDRLDYKTQWQSAAARCIERHLVSCLIADIELLSEGKASIHCYPMYPVSYNENKNVDVIITERFLEWNTGINILGEIDTALSDQSVRKSVSKKIFGHLDRLYDLMIADISQTSKFDVPKRYVSALASGRGTEV
ncbi:hypothetical protein [Ponticaulis sp.]|uniref:hypothetical protein n=1 Tax=Ponticaulis sp. TaxID=2020902 RepID=UPI00261B0011|nr:hypothetical protein [Ponticaulis sp.]MDF1679223.1 hypothetical protein [Ponticaulis sp.]